MDNINVIIVDDHQIVRDGICAILTACPHISVIGEASGYSELVNLLENRSPNVLILDISMPEKNGIEITRELIEKKTNIKILILTANIDEDTIIEAIQAGAHGFLPKDASREELTIAIESVNNEEGYFGEKLSKIIYKSYIHHVKKQKDSSVDESLSDREIEITRLLSNGLTSKEIAAILNISPRTVESHKNNILNRLQIKSVVELVKYAIKQGIVKI